MHCLSVNHYIQQFSYEHKKLCCLDVVNPTHLIPKEEKSKCHKVWKAIH